ncbi:MAG TPA: signal recognition particle-docking protein FtsY, partial [Candidatus Thermoplasmatota archaeon]|nr:signal recognition particle-docking protein FtsY [Candidatus Thermoplasmatota archaeon]
MRTRLLAALVAVGLLGVGPGISAASELPAPSAVPEGAAGLVVPSGEVREGATIQASTIDVRGTIQGVGGDLLLRATTV